MGSSAQKPPNFGAGECGGGSDGVLVAVQAAEEAPMTMEGGDVATTAPSRGGGTEGEGDESGGQGGPAGPSAMGSGGRGVGLKEDERGGAAIAPAIEHASAGVIPSKTPSDASNSTACVAFSARKSTARTSGELINPNAL
eukprot:CAMPEP_0177780450 /NCGR_PEP_ID=MMETSP0491_2-20121128/17208_1 /TAXON_ID=63592 /ORGANISM="Tetraselmis chuii, Strain PLY429" /LENGTH=139 /DNA_ID=CAMNT_0019300219 /DNA_START=35 /DNA_END=455 /DNA_ORIENTATION=-